MKLRFAVKCTALLLSTAAWAQITPERLLHANSEPQNWLSYSGSYMSQRYSSLAQITPANVKNLELKWVFQANSTEKFETTPLVVDGVMYVTQPPNDVVALDAKTGHVFWAYHYQNSSTIPCCGQVNRGLAILGDTLFMGTMDAHLIAIDAKAGTQLWSVPLADPTQGYSLTGAPLVVKDKVIVGTAGAEYGIRGFIAAFDVKSGKEAWRFYTIPAPGEPGSNTWTGDTWQHGGGSAWITGSYDPDANLVFWGTGNPGPDFNPNWRPGDNLYTSSVVALDADTGKLKWHFQFTPHDAGDWDSVQIPVLADINFQGAPRKVMLWANRNGFAYVLDRTSGKFLRGAPFVKQTWATALDENGRPIRAPNSYPTPEGTLIYPGIQGGTNWYSPSYSPRTGLFYVSAWQDYYATFISGSGDFTPGRYYVGGSFRSPIPTVSKRVPVNSWTEEGGHGEVMAIDPQTGHKAWTFPMHDVTDSGILTTASDLLFTGGREGYFYALDAKTGAKLWQITLGGQVAAGPISFEVTGTQYVAIAAGEALFVFGLR
jgi:alcohol dehydrogenase (cytochrome c)